MIESYISDRGIDEIERNNIKYLIIEHLEELKTQDYNMYNYLHSISKSNQQKFLYSLIDDRYESVEESNMALSLELGVLATSLGLIFYVFTLLLHDQPGFFSSITLIYRNLKDSVSNAITAFKNSMTKTSQSLNILISNNYHNCLAKCEIPEEFYSKHNSTLKLALNSLYSNDGFKRITRDEPGFVGMIKNIFGKGKYKLDSIQLECLVNCGLDSLTTVIAQYAGLYINCIKNSNTIYANTKIYTLLDLGRIPADIGTCNEVRENYKELSDRFLILLNYLFNSGNRRIINASTLHSRWVNILERKIQAASEGNYSALLDISKQFVGEHFIPSNQQEVRF